MLLALALDPFEEIFMFAQGDPATVFLFAAVGIANHEFFGGICEQGEAVVRMLKESLFDGF